MIGNLKNPKMLFVQFAYWLGAILDAVWGVVMLLYIFFGVAPLFASLNFPVPSDMVYFVLVAGTSLMF
jgi:hypothetical protein